MSRETGRETDSSSSGAAQGRGGAAYPSGTPPYGSRQYPSLHPTQDAPADAADDGANRPQQPEEPKTETTLTTRIRINIPGSRPIPPVVVRKTVSEAEKEKKNSAPAPQPAAAPAPPVEPAAPEPPARKEEKPTSDWFAPRKKGADTGPDTGGLPVPGADGQGAQGGPAYGSEPGGRPAQGPGGTDGRGMDLGGAAGLGGQAAPGGVAGGLGATTGAPAGPRRPGGPGAPDPFAPGPGRGPGGSDRPTPSLGLRPPGVTGPTGPTTGPVTGTAALGGGAPAPRMADDTFQLAPITDDTMPPPGGHVSGDTLTSGIPVITPESRGPNPLAPPLDGPEPMQFPAPDFPGAATPAAPAPGPSPRAARPAPQAPAKKGRSKLAMAAFGIVGLAGVAYGAGLLLNHSEVPKGTTVLGVDIGGGTKEDAVGKLDAAFGARAAKPLQVAVDGRKQELAPDKAGLVLDSQATVRGAAGTDYNPMSVIGSLFGGVREAEPVIPVDEEKLAVALADIAGASGSVKEATITFEPNRAVAVPGKAGKGLDVARSVVSVKDAYRAQVQTGASKVVELPVTTVEPTITQAELDRAMKEFAKPAMSGLITIKAGPKKIDFGPARSLPKILSMKAVDGRLIEVYDKKAIDELLDGVFDGIMITKADGKKHQVSADDVAFVMKDALTGKTKAERTKTIDLNGNG
ncbi:hypothetical protein ACGFMM_04250 [Streptomyces sp. NPDC048604]|uniref:hypothetical protein n=1 Tax=Streptomyces sp. NPDC048604 TaxID=3365578 RepID=UPI0037111AEB